MKPAVVQQPHTVPTNTALGFWFKVKHANLPLYLAEVPPGHQPLYSPFMWHSTKWQCCSSQAHCNPNLRASQPPNSAGVGTIRNDTGALNIAGLLGWHVQTLCAALHFTQHHQPLYPPFMWHSIILHCTVVQARHNTIKTFFNSAGVGTIEGI